MGWKRLNKELEFEEFYNSKSYQVPNMIQLRNSRGDVVELPRNIIKRLALMVGFEVK